MAPPPPSLSSLLPHSHSFLPPQNPHLTHRYMPSPRPSHSLSFTTRFSPDNKLNDDKITYPPPPPPPQQEKKSFAVATGELFLGIASRVLRSRNKNSYNNNKVSGLSLLEKSDDGNVDYEERIRAVMEDEVEPVVIWEQRVKDIEAEKERPVVTSPGFCFSAAGLLFPYHLGVAHLLIEKGYIKVSFLSLFVFRFLCGFDRVLCAFVLFLLEFVLCLCDVTSSCFGFSYLIFIIVHVGLVLHFFFFSLELETFVTSTGSWFLSWILFRNC